ncbi:MAG: ATP synthase F1 subunit delta [Anaeroplasmataceae bacterium]|nr:ATP synthase F1 subunit delta [Anaeroplasmataceae bacterium]
MVEYEYAKALFDLALEEKKIELFTDYLNAILDVTNREKDFLKLISSPSLELEEKIKIIKKVFASFDLTFVEFLKLIVKNQRFNSIAIIKEEYDKLQISYNRILKIEVISAEKLTANRLNQIEEKLALKYKNQKLIIENIVDPKILYGLQIMCNGESLDMSLKNRLYKLKESL